METKQTYNERIRHPSGALNSGRGRNRKARPWAWWIAGVLLLVYFFWRAGAFRYAPRGGSVLPAPAPANPHGWV